MKKYNMPKMEISLFDAEVVSTEETNEMSTKMAAFNEEMATIANSGGVARTITWDQLKVTW